MEFEQSPEGQQVQIVQKEWEWEEMVGTKTVKRKWKSTCQECKLVEEDIHLIPSTILSCLSLYWPSFPITISWWILILGWEGANHPIWSSLWHVVPKTILYSPILCILGLPFWSCFKVRGHLLCALSAPWMKWRHVLCGSIPASPSLHLLCLFEQPMGHNWCLTFLQGAWPFAFSPVLLWKIPAPPAVQVLL